MVVVIYVRMSSCLNYFPQKENKILQPKCQVQEGADING